MIIKPCSDICGTINVKESLKGTKVAYLATAAKDGTPTVVPIGTFKFLDDETPLISDQYFNKTLKNLQENPRIALSWWGEKGGFQIKTDITIWKSLRRVHSPFLKQKMNPAFP